MRPDHIVSATCQFYQLDQVELLGDSKLRHLSGPRHTLAWVLRKFTDLNWRAIGTVMGGRDARTIMNSVDVVITRKAADADYAERLHALEAHVKGWTPTPPSVAPTLTRARRLISSGEAFCDADAKACGICLLSVASILSSPDLTAEEARRGALNLLGGMSNG